MKNNHKIQMEKELLELQKMFDSDIKTITDKYYKLFENMTFESMSIENSLNNILHENIEDADIQKISDIEKIDIYNRVSELRKKRRYVSTKIDLIKFMSSTLKETMKTISKEVDFKKEYKFFKRETNIDKIKAKKMEVIK